MKEENKTPEETTPSFTDTLIETFLQAWQPAEKGDPGAEHKSTLTIVQEMAAMEEVAKWEINTALQQNGFKTTYIDGAFYWILKPTA